MNQTLLHAVRARAGLAAGWAVAALGFSLPISTTGDGVLLVAAVATWLVSGKAAELPGTIQKNRLVLLLPGLFLLFAVGAVHGLAPLDERFKYLWRYNDLLLPLIFVPIFSDPAVRQRALWGFGCGIAVTLVLSYLLAAGWNPLGPWFHGTAANAIVFRHAITQNVLMSMGALLFATAGAQQSQAWKRYGLSFLAACAVIDVFFFVEGRTGQVILALLIPIWFARRVGVRGLLVGIGVVLALVAVSYAVSPVFHDRVGKTLAEIDQAQREEVAPITSSIGMRMEWYRNTLGLIADSPVFGVGTGSFPRAYAEYVTNPLALKPPHPHNQYLLTAAELGVGGAIALILCLGTLWREFSFAVRSMYGELGQGAVIAMAIGCLFNSLFLDHTEGLFFAWIWSTSMASLGDNGRHGS